MSRKKIHSKIRRLIQNSVTSRHRSMFYILGEKSREQVVFLYHLLVKYRTGVLSNKPSVVWFFKKDLKFNLYNDKRLKYLKKKYIGNNILDEEDLYDHFLLSANAQFCNYSETDKMLGQTFGMMIIQDFRALTPNTIARIVECVEGGGMIIFLLSNITDLADLFSLEMDAHSHYVTEAYPKIIPRFNKRFVLSLNSCQNCLVLDDSFHIKLIPENFDAFQDALENKVQIDDEKKSIPKSSTCNNISKLLHVCCTSDQSTALLKLNEALNNRNIFSIVSLTSGRGRGKSSVLGLALSIALTSSYSNVYITSPHLENLQTFFSFLVKGLAALDCVEDADYKIFRTEAKPVCLISGIRVFKENARTVTYLSPIDAHKVGSADLVVLDEAAAIPLPLVKKWIGSYTVFMASTINGYEGTGRSLSLKLIRQLSSQCVPRVTTNNKFTEPKDKGHVLIQIQLNEAIRYANGDEVEGWLSRLLCLEASLEMHIQSTPPQPESCDLYYVNMDVLFGYNKAAEKFLQQMVSLFVTSHYKNSPNDLMMMADAPAHHVFCLLPPVNPDTTELPTVLCAIQVALEGKISEKNISTEHSLGRRASGDLIPWIVSQQFQNNDFPSLSGARVVRIATHPEYQRMGYGKHALNLLSSFYTASAEYFQGEVNKDKESHNRPLLTKLKDMPDVSLDYLGVSYGLTTELFRFWKKCGFVPLYVRQTTSETTGEHSCIMIKNLKSQQQWPREFFYDFAERFLSLLTSAFKELPVSLVLEMLKNKNLPLRKDIPPEVFQWFFTSRSLERMNAFCSYQVDYHLILDLLPTLTKCYFLGCFGGFFLYPDKEGVLMCIGLQNKSAEATATDVCLKHEEVMGILRKAVQKILTKLPSYLRSNREPNGVKVEKSHNQTPTMMNPFYSESQWKKNKKNEDNFSNSTKKSKITYYD